MNFFNENLIINSYFQGNQGKTILMRKFLMGAIFFYYFLNYFCKIWLPTFLLEKLIGMRYRWKSSLGI
jgi:hypothetical protein